MPSALENVKVGVCTVQFAGADLGYTKGGVEVEVSTETYKVTVDQFGNTPINDYITGRMISVKTPLAETTIDNLVSIMPGAVKTIDGIDATKIKVEVSNGLGTNLIDLADKLVLHPKANALADLSEDIVVPKASTPGNMTFSYQLEAERVFDCTWTGYPDTANGNILFIVGDETATA